MKLTTIDRKFSPLLKLLCTYVDLYPLCDSVMVEVKWNQTECDPVVWKREKQKVFISGATNQQMLAALGAALCAKEGEEGVCKAKFKQLEAMLDVSRNAVYTLPTLKRFLCQIALMGYTGCMLYMEDTYELPAYPYWGYRRGKYSTQELRELDIFAQELGLELVPCIQTLAHLRTALHWQYMQPIKDTPDNLMVGASGTETFVDAMLEHLSNVFSSRRIHLGMDEAVSLGMGRYRLVNGYKHHKELTMEHLKMVCRLCDKYGLEPMIWDDMLFRDNTPQMNYYCDSAPITPEERAEYPQNLSFVYWDYYHDNKEEYIKQILRRGDMKTIFAGGVWKWGGWTPNLTKSFRDSKAALEACAETGVQEVIVTLWGDDGAEAPLDCVLPGMALFGVAQFGDADVANTEPFCRLLADCCVDTFEAMEKLDLIPGMPDENLEGQVPHKLLLYGDLASELFMPSMTQNPEELQQHFEALARTFQKEQQETTCISTQRMLTLYQDLAQVLALRCETAEKLHRSWREKDKDVLRSVQLLLKKLKESVAVFHNDAIMLWSYTCKGQGMEIIDLRLGGLQGRCDALSMRLELYLRGRISTLSELEEDFLPYAGVLAKDGKTPGRESYGQIVTANTLCHIFEV